jgi:hypothetical protein
MGSEFTWFLSDFRNRRIGNLTDKRKRMSGKDQILDTADKIKEALFRQDTEALKELFANDYRSFDIRGVEEDRNLILGVYSPGGAKLDVYSMDQVQLDVFEETGILTGRGRVQGHFGEHSFEHTIRFTDIYRREKGHWRLWMSHATEIQAD